jgi:ADP-heptose:LPS heptosyltransferase
MPAPSPTENVVPPVPEGAGPDLAAAWPAMCPPVRERYAAAGAGSRARELALRWLRWQARRHVQRPGNGATTAGAANRDSVIPAQPRILAIQPDHLGGMLLTTPALRLLKLAWPDSEITVLAGPWAADVPAHCPAVSRVRVTRFPGFERAAPPGGLLGGLRAKVTPYTFLYDTAAALADEGFHLAITFHADYWQGAVVSALSRIPHRLGYAVPEAVPFLSLGLPRPRLPIGATGRDLPRPHVAELGLALARQAITLAGLAVRAGFDGRMLYEPSAAERAEAWRLWQANELHQTPAVVAVHPAPGAAAKRWPPQRFALLGDHLAGRYGARIVLTGGPADVEEARAIAAASWQRPVVLAGQTSFGTLAALLERCRFAVGTDNGAMHLATARGVPTLRLFGPVDAPSWRGWTGYDLPAAADGPQATLATQGDPGGQGAQGMRQASPPALVVTSTIPCAPCHRLDLPAWSEVGGGEAYPCMQDISVERVVAAAEELWKLTAGR